MCTGCVCPCTKEKNSEKEKMGSVSVFSVFCYSFSKSQKKALWCILFCNISFCFLDLSDISEDDEKVHLASPKENHRARLGSGSSWGSGAAGHGHGHGHGHGPHGAGHSRRDSKLDLLRVKTKKLLKEIDAHQQDALQDYIELTIAAVKINFANISVKHHELKTASKGLPFHRIHDKLTCFMIEKMKKQADQQER